MKIQFILLFLCVVVIFPAWGQAEPTRGIKQVQDQRRIALVIGNSDYQKMGRLLNPENDAADMATALTDSGFQVTLKTNLDRTQMRQAIRDFGDELRNGAMGLFYFAGHGVQVNGSNYLIPVGANIQREDEVEDTAVDANLILRKMKSASNELNLVVLDACRNNPFYRSFRNANKGLARMDAPKGTFIIYSTRPGQVALDGKGRNSPFVKQFLEQMKVPGLEVGLMMREIAEGLELETGSRQVPWMEGLITGRFYFTPQLPTFSEKEEEAWSVVKDSNDLDVVQMFLQDFPDGKYAFPARVKLKNLTPPDPQRDQLADQVVEAIQLHAGDDPKAGRVVKKYVDTYGLNDLKARLRLSTLEKYKLGVLYRNGYGLEINNVEAVFWFKQSAQKGHSWAQTRLGFMFRNGLGAGQDFSEALSWYQKAADQGHAQAQFNLGGMYWKGYGIPKDKKQAVVYYQKAANQGHRMAQRVVSLIGDGSDYE
ncbi:MAG: caspase family protein [SAR324 cluster bacterium]|nr:caspase family protein [SAR324 cluster bacterium]